jgi:hypothetical protein
MTPRRRLPGLRRARSVVRRSRPDPGHRSTVLDETSGGGVVSRVGYRWVTLVRRRHDWGNGRPRTCCAHLQTGAWARFGVLIARSPKPRTSRTIMGRRPCQVQRTKSTSPASRQMTSAPERCHGGNSAPQITVRNADAIAAVRRTPLSSWTTSRSTDRDDSFNDGSSSVRRIAPTRRSLLSWTSHGRAGRASSDSCFGLAEEASCIAVGSGALLRR